MSRQELSAVIAIALLMAFRMLGMFMILPIFATQAIHLVGATPGLIGLALGIYGLTQALLQIPFGALSDHIGRKPVIAFGLILLILGSIIAAHAQTLYGIILGRAIQGAGAIGSTCLALLADLTRDQHRSKAMAMVGMMIGLSFSIAIVLGPLLNHAFNLAGVFYTTALLGGIALVLLFTLIGTPPTLSAPPEQRPSLARYLSVIRDTQLLRLDLGIFCQHAILTSLFVVLPLILTHQLQLASHQQTILYLTVLAVAFIASIPLIIVAEKRRKIKPVFLMAIATLAITSEGFIKASHSVADTVTLLFLFFCAFSLLEACLPSLVSKTATITLKGLAMGIYSTSQFMGIFVGGSLSGWLYGHTGTNGVLLIMACLGILWFLAAFSMKHPPYLSTIILPAPLDKAAQLATQLPQTDGIADAAFSKHEQLMYIKIDKHIISTNELRNLVEDGSLA